MRRATGLSLAVAALAQLVTAIQVTPCNAAPRMKGDEPSVYRALMVKLLAVKTAKSCAEESVASIDLTGGFSEQVRKLKAERQKAVYERLVGLIDFDCAANALTTYLYADKWNPNFVYEKISKRLPELVRNYWRRVDFEAAEPRTPFSGLNEISSAVSHSICEVVNRKAGPAISECLLRFGIRSSP